MKIASIVGARPQFIKLTPLIREIQKHNKSNSKQKIEHLIIHTGQHYNYEMNKIFFGELEIPEPDHNLEVGSGSHGCQTGEMLIGVEKILIKENPDFTFVYGDTNSTLAGALAASKAHIPLAHIEAGLRSYNKRMPEEINRVLTDHCSDVLFCPTENAVKNLKKEGFLNIINKDKIIEISSAKLSIDDSRQAKVINVGDIMYDSLFMSLESIEMKSKVLEKYGLRQKKYYLLTVHRPENTDDKENLSNILTAAGNLDHEVIFPIHPRTQKMLKIFNLDSSEHLQNIRLIDPVSYFDILMLEKNALRILTDSGGMQKEAYFFKVPCITLRNETEWVETVESGWNVNARSSVDRIISAVQKSEPACSQPDVFGNGKAAEYILKCITDNLFI